MRSKSSPLASFPLLPVEPACDIADNLNHLSACLRLHSCFALSDGLVNVSDLSQEIMMLLGAQDMGAAHLMMMALGGLI